MKFRVLLVCRLYAPCLLRRGVYQKGGVSAVLTVTYPEGVSERTRQRTIRISDRVTQRAVKHDPRRHNKPNHNFQTYALRSVSDA